MKRVLKILSDGKKLLNFMKQNNGILENKMIIEAVLKKKERTVSNVIKELVDLNVIKRIGLSKNGHWRLK